MTLGDKQRRFALMVSKLIQYIYDNGYECTLRDAYAYPEDNHHIKNSKHYQQLAIDLNLFKDKKYLTKSEDHQQFGRYWESIGGTWGGNFTKKDGNHYQL